MGCLVCARGHDHQLRAIQHFVAAACHAHGGQQRSAMGDIQRLSARLVSLEIYQRYFLCQPRLCQSKCTARAHLPRANDCDFRHILFPSLPLFCITARKDIHNKKRLANRVVAGRPFL